MLLRLRVAEVLHRHLCDGLPDCFDQRPELRPDLIRNRAADVVAIEYRDPAPVPVVVDDRHEVLPERDGPAGVLIQRFPVLLRDEPRGCEDRVVIEQPLLDEQPERERDLIAVFLPQVRELLADLDDAPEESVLVRRVGTVPLDDVVDPAVLGEIHTVTGRDRGAGRYGCRFLLGEVEASIKKIWVISATNFIKLRVPSNSVLYICQLHQRLSEGLLLSVYLIYRECYHSVLR